MPKKHPPVKKTPSAKKIGAKIKPAKNVFERGFQALSTLSFAKKNTLSLLLGLLSVLALPPFFMFPVLLISFPIWLTVIQSTTNNKQAFFTGWWFGFGHFVAGLYWISNSLLVDAEHFAWLIPFAVSLIPAVLAIYAGLFAAILRRLKLSGWRLLLAASSLWVMVEFARAYCFTGFPWNLIGYSWAWSDAMIQLASITGIWGLSLLAMLFATSPLLLLEKKHRIAGYIFLLLPALIWCGGVVRLSNADNSLTHTTVRVVQANIKQQMKWEDAYRFTTFMQHVMASTDPHLPAADIIVWPETAVPFVLEREGFIREIIAKHIPAKSTIITGALRMEERGEDYQLWNSLFAVSGRGEVVGHYDKVRLVPFGEYVPFRALLPFVDKITFGSKDFSSGLNPVTLTLSEKPAFAPLICYEVIYPDNIIDPKDRPQWIVNITNDAWFGRSTGPYQHFTMAKLRAVEQGLPLVRAANTGISGIFDGYGRVLSRIPLSSSGAIQAQLPKALPPTAYSKWGGISIMVGVVALLFFAVFIEFKRQKV